MSLDYFLTMPWATDALLLVFAWVGFVTLGVLLIKAGQTVTRARRVMRAGRCDCGGGFVPPF